MADGVHALHGFAHALQVGDIALDAFHALLVQRGVMDQGSDGVVSIDKLPRQLAPELPARSGDQYRLDALATRHAGHLRMADTRCKGNSGKPRRF